MDTQASLSMVVELFGSTLLFDVGMAVVSTKRLRSQLDETQYGSSASQPTRLVWFVVPFSPFGDHRVQVDESLVQAISSDPDSHTKLLPKLCKYPIKEIPFV